MVSSHGVWGLLVTQWIPWKVTETPAWSEQAATGTGPRGRRAERRETCGEGTWLSAPDQAKLRGHRLS